MKQIIALSLFTLFLFPKIISAQNYKVERKGTVTTNICDDNLCADFSINYKIIYDAFFGAPNYMVLGKAQKTNNYVNYLGRNYNTSDIGEQTMNQVKLGVFDLSADVYNAAGFKVSSVYHKNVTDFDIPAAPDWNQIFPGLNAEQAKNLYREGFQFRNIRIINGKLLGHYEVGSFVRGEEKKKAEKDAEILKWKQENAQRQKAAAEKAEADRLERLRQFEIQQKAAQKIKEDKEAADRLLSQSQSLMLQNKYAEAEEALLRAKELDPTNIHVKAMQGAIDGKKEWESKYLKSNSSFGTPIKYPEGTSKSTILLNAFSQGLDLWASGAADRQRNALLKMQRDAEEDRIAEEKRKKEAIERRIAEKKRQKEQAEREREKVERENYLAEIKRKVKQERDTFLAELPKSNLQGLPDTLSSDMYGFFILQDPKEAIYSTRPFVIRSNFREYYATSDELSVFLRPYLNVQAKKVIFQGPFDDYEIALQKLSFLKAYYPNLGNEQTFIDPIIYKNKKSGNSSFWGTSTKDSTKPIPTISKDFWGLKNN